MADYYSNNPQIDRLRKLVLPYEERWYSVIKWTAILGVFLFGSILLNREVDMRPVIFFIIAIISIPYIIFFRAFERAKKEALHCPHCHADTPLLSEWVCGNCYRIHKPREKMMFTERTFVQPCANCRFPQHSLLCHKCGKPIVFDTFRANSKSYRSAFLVGQQPVAVEEKPRMDPTIELPPTPVYEEAAARALGVQTDGYPIGTFKIIEANDTVLDAIVAERLNHVETALPPRPDDVEDLQIWRTIIDKHVFLPFDKYVYAVKNIKNLSGDEYRRFKELYSAHRHHPTRQGWKEYLKQTDFFGILTREVPAAIPERARLHVYICGQTGSGKSELLKRLVFPYVETPTAAVVALDPAGDFADQIAHWPEIQDRLIYVRHDLDRGLSPTINPLEIPDVPASDTSPDALAVKKVVAQQLLEALEEVIAEDGGSDLTKNMKTVLRPCLLALLDREGATLRDLQRFMDVSRNAELVAFGRSLSHYPDLQEFFEHSFNQDNFKITKTAIRTKLQDLFTTGTFAALTCGPSTINLSEEWNEKKIVVFNLSKGKMGEREARSFGILIVALLQGIALRRADMDESKRVPCHLIADEMHNFVTPSIRTIMLEARKYKLFYTGAQQIVGDGMTAEIKSAILANSPIKIGGMTEPSARNATAALFPVEPEDIATLRRGLFYMRVGPNSPFKVRIATDLLGHANAMTDAEWERVKERQLANYYRPLAVSGPAEVSVATKTTPASLAPPEDDSIAAREW